MNSNNFANISKNVQKKYLSACILEKYGTLENMEQSECSNITTYIAPMGSGKTTLIKDIILKNTNTVLCFPYKVQYNDYMHFYRMHVPNKLVSGKDAIKFKRESVPKIMYNNLLYTNDILGCFVKYLGITFAESTNGKQYIYSTKGIHYKYYIEFELQEGCVKPNFTQFAAMYSNLQIVDSHDTVKYKVDMLFAKYYNNIAESFLAKGAQLIFDEIDFSFEQCTYNFMVLGEYVFQHAEYFAKALTIIGSKVRVIGFTATSLSYKFTSKYNKFLTSYEEIVVDEGIYTPVNIKKLEVCKYNNITVNVMLKYAINRNFNESKNKSIFYKTLWNNDEVETIAKFATKNKVKCIVVVREGNIGFVDDDEEEVRESSLQKNGYVSVKYYNEEQYKENVKWYALIDGKSARLEDLFSMNFHYFFTNLSSSRQATLQPTATKEVNIIGFAKDFTSGFVQTLGRGRDNVVNATFYTMRANTTNGLPNNSGIEYNDLLKIDKNFNCYAKDISATVPLEFTNKGNIGNAVGKAKGNAVGKAKGNAVGTSTASKRQSLIDFCKYVTIDCISVKNFKLYIDFCNSNCFVAVSYVAFKEFFIKIGVQTRRKLL